MSRDRLDIMELYHECGPGGAEQMVLDLCRWLGRDGHRVRVVTCRPGWLETRLREAGVETHLIPQTRRFDIGTLRAVLALDHGRPADVFHVHELPAMLGMAPAAFARRLPMVGTVHGRENIAARGRRRLICRLAARCCRQVVAVSRFMQRFLADDVGVASRRMTMIYNGIDIERYARPTGVAALRAALGIASGAPVIGTVGSLYPVKGQIYLLQAMARIAAEVPAAVCLIAGRGELRERLEGEAAALGVADRVKFLGYRTDVPDLLGVLDVFALPSLSEGLPLSLLEAQAAGKPVVASQVGGSPEVVEEGDNGFLVPPRRAELLADGITRLLCDRPLARAMGERGRDRVRRVFSLDAMGRAYLDVFEACQRARPRRLAWAGA